MSGPVGFACRAAFRALVAYSRPLAAELTAWAAGELARESVWADLMRSPEWNAEMSEKDAGR